MGLFVGIITRKRLIIWLFCTSSSFQDPTKTKKVA